MEFTDNPLGFRSYALTAVGKTAAVSLPYTGDPSGIWGKYAIICLVSSAGWKRRTVNA